LPHREHHRWYSPKLEREMELLTFGHAGARMLVFPTSMGRFFEWEDQGMMRALGEHLERGWLHVCCVDSVDGESWYAKHRHPAERAFRHQQYERYILDEVLPFTWHRNPTPFQIAAGASFGAYHALNIALRYPGAFNRVIGLSGLYDIKQMTGGYSDEHVYRHDPSHYLLNEHDPHRLAMLRRLEIILAIGQDDPSRENNEHISRALWSRNIWHALRIWDGWAHDWPWWREMIRHYAGGAN
jgi:esterase/lipase superfamily enzyme